ncbi:MAG: hypothetical protein HY423_14630 [Candidatus Lambdaproteobacteria bacterium]|nr:hypothetical protein [Candidatus Lambdaproteobacteria bacterium]
MDHPSDREIAELFAAREGHRVSIYLPTHRAGGEEQDPILLKNLLREAGAALTARGERTAVVKRCLQPAYDLVVDRQFWQVRGDGLAIFLSKDGDFRRYRLPIAFKPIAVIGTRYHVKPLLPLLAPRREFFILALSQQEARLLAATPDDVGRIHAEGMPAGLADALRYEDTALAPHMRPGTSRTGSGRYGQLFHGHGGEGDSEKGRIERYFRQIDQSLRPLLQGRACPLVLAGVHYLQAIYRGVNSHAELPERGILSSPDNLSDRELHEQALPIVTPLFLRKQEAASAEYDRLAGEGRATNRLDDVVSAAQAGRVATLFVDPSVELWGRVLSGLKPIELHDRPLPGDEDLLDYVAALTLASRGAVYAVAGTAMPSEAFGSAASAILRY